MTRPLTLREPAIGAFIAGTLTRIRRPLPGLYANAQPGDLLWIREPFHLDPKWNGLSPTAAAGLGARPVFVADGKEPLADLGVRRHARTLLRDWHRQHARVLAVEQQQLQAITDEEARAEGFRDRRDWGRSWDQARVGFAVGHDPCRWQMDPRVIVLALERIAKPLPGDTPSCGLTKAELEVLTRWEAGQTRDEIAQATGINRGVVSRAVSFASEEAGRKMQEDIRAGSRALRDALFRETTTADARRALARKLSGTATDFIPLVRPMPALSQPRDAADRRPPAFGREPCPYCQTRGDLGCAHFAPCEPVPA